MNTLKKAEQFFREKEGNVWDSLQKQETQLNKADKPSFIHSQSKSKHFMSLAKCYVLTLHPSCVCWVWHPLSKSIFLSDDWTLFTKNTGQNIWNWYIYIQTSLQISIFVCIAVLTTTTHKYRKKVVHIQDVSYNIRTVICIRHLSKAVLPCICAVSLTCPLGYFQLPPQSLQDTSKQFMH